MGERSFFFVFSQFFVDEFFDFRDISGICRIVEKAFSERLFYFDFPFFGKQRNNAVLVAAVSDEEVFDEFFAFLPAFFGGIDDVEDKV